MPFVACFGFSYKQKSHNEQCDIQLETNTEPKRATKGIFLFWFLRFLDQWKEKLERARTGNEKHQRGTKDHVTEKPNQAITKPKPVRKGKETTNRNQVLLVPY